MTAESLAIVGFKASPVVGTVLFCVLSIFKGFSIGKIVLTTVFGGFIGVVLGIVWVVGIAQVAKMMRWSREEKR